jgi:thioredoxin reductase (NADPH)
LEEVEIEHIPSGKTEKRKIDGVFVFIGYVPNSEDFSSEVETNEWGEIVVNNEFQTSIEGVYAAGDVITKRYRQITTAVSDGTQAALNVAEYVNNLEKENME